MGGAAGSSCRCTIQEKYSSHPESWWFEGVWFKKKGKRVHLLQEGRSHKPTLPDAPQVFFYCCFQCLGGQDGGKAVRLLHLPADMVHKLFNDKQQTTLENKRREQEIKKERVITRLGTSRRPGLCSPSSPWC